MQRAHSLPQGPWPLSLWTEAALLVLDHLISAASSWQVLPEGLCEGLCSLARSSCLPLSEPSFIACSAPFRPLRISLLSHASQTAFLILASGRLLTSTSQIKRTGADSSVLSVLRMACEVYHGGHHGLLKKNEAGSHSEAQLGCLS